MGHLSVLWQARGNDTEAVILAGDLDLAGGEVFDRMIGAAMADRHLLGLAAEREGEELMPEANAEQRLAAGDELLDNRHGVFAGRRRIARAVRKEDAVRIVAQDILGARRCGHHRDVAALACPHPEDIALGAIIDRDNLVLRRA
jgi:hypothetical protein